MSVMGNEYAGFLCYSKRNIFWFKKHIIFGSYKVAFFSSFVI